MASILDLTTDLLRSNQIRTLATGTVTGTRSIGGELTVRDDDGGLLAPLWGALVNIGKGIAGAIVKVGGFLLNTLMGGFRFTWTALVAQLQSAAMFLWNFNFNATDTELDATYAQFLTVLGGQLGGTIGNAIGWLTCGAVPGLVLMKFNKVLAARVLTEVGEEALDELVANLRTLVLQAQQLMFRWSAIQAFKSGRRVIKEVLKNPESPMARLFKLAGGDPQKVQEWGEKGRKPWSFAIALDTWIESIKSDFWQNFTEELIEEFFDSCSEAFYVVANAADQYALEKGVEGTALLGPDEVVEIQPNRNDPSERIILAGPQELLAPNIVQTMTQYQMLEHRDLGMWVGEPVRENLKTRPVSIQMRILMSGHQSTLVGYKRVQITIPDVDRAKIDWEQIKLAVGGSNGYMWGRFKGTAQLSGGNKMSLYADTDSNAVDLLQKLVVFSNQEILGITVVEEKKEGSRKTISALYKEPTRIYPYGFTIINQQKVLNEESGIAQVSGIYRRKSAGLIDLTSDTRPDDFSETIAELFRIPGQNA